MKCFIIRLKENAHSCTVAKECFDAAVIHGLSPEYFDAINGNEAESHYASTGIHRAKKFKKGRPGVMGCFFSHYYLWQRCVELNEPIVILEHDGYVIKPIPDSILGAFDDVLKLDPCDPFSSTYDQDVDKTIHEVITVEKYNNPKAKDTSTKSFAGTGNYFRGTYSYIVKPQGAKKLIEFVHEHGHLPSDQQIGDQVLDTRVTASTLARLHPIYSVGDNIKSLSLTRDLK